MNRLCQGHILPGADPGDRPTDAPGLAGDGIAAGASGGSQTAPAPPPAEPAGGPRPSAPPPPQSRRDPPRQWQCAAVDPWLRIVGWVWVASWPQRSGEPHWRSPEQVILRREVCLVAVRWPLGEPRLPYMGDPGDSSLFIHAWKCGHLLRSFGKPIRAVTIGPATLFL